MLGTRVKFPFPVQYILKGIKTPCGLHGEVRSGFDQQLRVKIINKLAENLKYIL